MSKQFIKKRALFPIAVLIALATLGTWHYAQQRENKILKQQLELDTQRISAQLSSRLEGYQILLSQLAMVIEQRGGEISREDWQKLIGGILEKKSMPGTQGIGFSVMFSDNRVEEHNRLLAQLYGDDFVHYPEGERSLRSSIQYLEPLDWRNERAIGYDMYSHPLRREAMDTAIRDQVVVVSNPVTLVQETDSDIQQGFLLYAAALRAEGQSPNEMTADNDVIGFAYAVVRGQDFFDANINEELREILNIELVDSGVSAASEAAIAASRQITYLPDFTAEEAFSAGTRTWLVRAQATPAYLDEYRSNTPEWIAASVAVFGLFLLGFIGNIYQQGVRVEQRARELNKEVLEQTNRLRLAQDSDLFGTWEYHPESGSLYWDDKSFEVFGLAAQEFSPSLENWLNLVDEADREELKAALGRAIESGESMNLQFRFSRKDGSNGHAAARSLRVSSAEDGEVFVVGVYRDISRDIEALQKSELAASVFSYANEGIMITDADLRIVDVNATFEKITGYSKEDVLGHTPSILKSGEHSNAFYEGMWDAIRSQGQWSGEICNRRRDGEHYYELLHVSRISDARGDVVSYVGIFSDISVQKAHESELEFLASHDSLTGLPNRAYLHSKLEKRIARMRLESSRKRLGFLYIDLDHFKEVNDKLGHPVGDSILKEVGDKLLRTLEPPNLIARFGGDEFVAVCEVASQEQLKNLIEKLISELTESLTTDSGEQINLSASVGVSFYPQDGTDVDTLIRQADKAMYEVKIRGRGSYAFYDAGQDQESRRHAALLREMERALDEEEFEVWYQPKIALADTRAVGAEALIRWRHPERGLLLPASFVRESERDELSIRMGEWTIQKVLELLAEERDAFPDQTISVNLSSAHLSSNHLVPFLVRQQQLYGADVLARLELEVLESYPLQNEIRTLATMRECRALGVGFAIDDFGTGYSSMAYLRKLPAETLKIDRSFIANLDTDDYDRSIVEAVISISRVYGKKLVAEGVESEAVANLLRDLGCEFAQGFYFAKPMALEEYRSWKGSWQRES